MWWCNKHGHLGRAPTESCEYYPSLDDLKDDEWFIRLDQDVPNGRWFLRDMCPLSSQRPLVARCEAFPGGPNDFSVTAVYERGATGDGLNGRTGYFWQGISFHQMSIYNVVKAIREAHPLFQSNIETARRSWTMIASASPSSIAYNLPMRVDTFSELTRHRESLNTPKPPTVPLVRIIKTGRKVVK